MDRKPPPEWVRLNLVGGVMTGMLRVLAGLCWLPVMGQAQQAPVAQIVRVDPQARDRATGLAEPGAGTLATLDSATEALQGVAPTIRIGSPVTAPLDSPMSSRNPSAISCRRWSTTR